MSKNKKPAIEAGFAIRSPRMFSSDHKLEGKATRLDPWIIAAKNYLNMEKLALHQRKVRQ
jgi:hypothetical protein